MANDPLIKKELQAKDQIQYGTVRSCEKTSERSKAVPHRIFKTYKRLSKDLKGMPHRSGFQVSQGCYPSADSQGT